MDAVPPPRTRCRAATDAAPRARVRLGHRLGHRYRIDGVLGEGGMATVYAAHDLVLGRDVAVKVQVPIDPAVADAAFEQEMRIGAGVRHPGLTTVFDAGTDEVDGAAVCYLVMEQAVRGDLRRHLLVHGPVPWRDAASTGADLAEGLAHLHARGYLHRDVKPANIMIDDVEADGRLRAMLADFGISSPSATGATAAGRSLGTAAYISPEQVAGDDPTDRSDVYALGLVLLEMLSGRVEYPGDVQASATARLRRDPTVPAGLPPRAADLLRAMTDRRPLRRPTAASVGERLRDLLADDPVRRSPGDPRAAEGDSAPGAALDRYDVTGWPPRRAFTTSTTLAARLLRTRWAGVVVVEDGRPRLVASTGAPEPLALQRWGRLLDAAGPVPWSIPDLGAVLPEEERATARVHGLRSFAGAPLTTLHGDVLGTLCVVDDRPRTFAQHELDDLATLASVITSELELRLAARRALFAR
jgi:eukaryotic-like serine/threonine-protein kinase